MGLYAKAALIAYDSLCSYSIEPLAAWQSAMEEVTEKVSVQRKGCPRVTFLALVYGGYLKGIASHPYLWQVGVLHDRAIDGAKYLLENIECDAKKLGAHLGYHDKQGSCDILLALMRSDILVYPSE